MEKTSEHEIKRHQFINMMKSILHIDDTRGVELFATIQRAAHLSEMLDNQLSDDQGLSGPRWRMLLQLYIHELHGNTEGLMPTDMSKLHRVSKNTISALLRGLEDQGLVERSLDPNDLRVFRIRLTQAGRELMKISTPRRVEGLNQMLAGFTDDEIEQLSALMNKLLRSLYDQVYRPVLVEE